MTVDERRLRRSSVMSAIDGSGAGAVSISRATDPLLVAALAASMDVEELPAVGCRTVWRQASHRVIVEQPNDWGWSTPEPPAGALVIDHRLAAASWAHRSRVAHRLRKRLESLRRVRAACSFDAPWFVLLTPVAGADIERAAVAAGIQGVTAMGAERPEFPGGVRIEVPNGPETEWVDAWVASLAATIEAEIGEA